MFGWLFPKKLSSILAAKPKRVKVGGVIFKIKKINPLDHLTGAQVVMKAFETYEVSKGDEKAQLLSAKKIQQAYTDVLMAGVVEPKLSRKNDGNGIFVENLFTDWSLVEGLYNAIFEHTYGKKKLKYYGSRASA